MNVNNVISHSNQKMLAKFATKFIKRFSTGMIVTRDEESDTDVRVSELMLRLTDMSLLVCLGFIKVNADLVAPWSERGKIESTLEDCG